MELTLDQALQKGIEAHKAGKAQDADRYYTAILKANPKHPDANHNMGVLAVGIGKVQEALPFFKTALEANSNTAQFWLSYIDALIKLNQLDEAQAVFEQAKEKGQKGDDFDQIEERLGAVNSSISNTQEPSKDQLSSLINLYKKGQYLEILNKSSHLLEQFPSSINLYNTIGAANYGLAKYEEAIEAYNKALSITPDFAGTYNNLGAALQAYGKPKEAIKAYKKALSIKPDYFEAHNNLGNTFKEQGKLGKALDFYNKALSIRPDYAEAYNNKGVTLQQQGKLDEAIEAYDKALSIKPDYAEAYNNTTELLKTHSPESERDHNLFNIDGKIKKLSPRILHAKSDEELIDSLAVGLSYIQDESFNYKTPLSQIYKRNTVDLNCKRHMKIFDAKDIIPEFCFACFKVQVEVATVIDLVKITSLFYKFDFDEDLTRKTMIELRTNISGYYKGLIYCRGLDQAKAVKSALDVSLREIFGTGTLSQIKRGCSEYPLKFPTYGKIPKNPKRL